MKIFMIYGCICYFMVGSMHVLFGSLLPSLIAEQGLEPSMGGMLIFLQFAGFLLGILISPWIIRYTSRLSTINGFQLLLGISLLGVAWSPEVWIILCMAVVVGFSSGSLESTTGSLTLDQHRGDRAISILEVVFGVGALSLPLLINYSNLVSWDWRYILYLFCAILFLNFLFHWKYANHLKILDKNTMKVVESANEESLPRKQNMSVMILFAVFAFFYAGLETNFANYLPLLVEGLFPDSSAHLYSISAFWLGMIIGRLFVGTFMHKIPKHIFIIAMSIAAFVGLGSMMILQSGVAILVNVFLIGLLLAGIFPISLFNFTESLTGKNASLTASTFFIGAASLGGSIISLIIGPTIEFQGVIPAVSLFLLISTILIVLSILILKRKKNSISSSYASTYNNQEYKNTW